MIFSDKPNKEIIDIFTERHLIELYTMIAGITSGYISATQRDFGISKEEAQKWVLEIDKRARDKVAEAYHIRDSMKDDQKED